MPKVRAQVPRNSSCIKEGAHQNLGDSMSAPSNKRLKLTAPVNCGKLAVVNVPVWRRSLGASR